MKYLFFLLIAIIAWMPTFKAQSTLLESVKRNPSEAKALCKEFKDLNAQGISASSQEVISRIANKKNISQTDAEIFSIYVIGMNCKEVR